MLASPRIHRVWTQFTAALWKTVKMLGDSQSRLPGFWIVVSILFAIQLSRTIHDVDIFWQLKLGDIILSQGISKTEPFLADKEAEPFIPIGWLAQVIYASIHDLGGWPFLRLVDALVWFAGFVVVAWTGRSERNHWSAILGLYVAWIPSIAFASIRPQSLALLYFGLLLVLARKRDRHWRRLALAGLILLFWQNCHPSVITAVVYLGTRAVGEFFDGWKQMRATLPASTLILTGLAIAVMPMTPAGWHLLPLAAYNAEISRVRGVTEWQSLLNKGWPDWERGDAWVAILLTVFLMLIFRRRLVFADTLPTIVLTAMTLLSHRFIVFWAIAIIPIWISALTPASHPIKKQASPKTRRWIAGLGLLLSMGFPLWLWPAPFAEYFPFPAIQQVKAHRIHGVIYSNFFWGGVIIEACYPESKVTHDGRYYLRSPVEWEQYERAAAGEIPLEQLERQFQPSLFFLRFQYDDGLIQRLETRADWKEMFRDSQSILFVRQ